MRVGVLGSGEVAVACALSLWANGSVEHAGPRRVTLMSRDPHTITNTTKPHTTDSATAPVFSAFANARVAVPSSDFTLARVPTKAGSTAAATELPQDADTLDALFICTPLSSFMESAKDTALHGGHPPPTAVGVAHQFLTSARQHPRHARASDSLSPPFLALFTRGLTEDGNSPAQVLQHGLAGTGSGVPLLVASGPVFAKEWAMQCAPASGENEDGRASHGIPPRPPSHRQADPTHGSGAPAESPLKHRRESARFTGTSLCFALTNPSSVDPGLGEAVRAQLLTSCFPRENVSVLLGEDMAAIVSLVNACALLCAFGGGLVSNAFAGTSVSALASYTQHAQRSVQGFVNGVLARPEGSPLPLEMCSTVAMACANYSTREFALGRKMDFYFRHEDALNAVYGGRGAFEMTQTMGGIHTLLKKHDLRNPFLETLMDTFHTLLRASTVGAGLVKEGIYDGGHGEMNAVLQYALRVDEAMLSGDEQQFDEAKKRMQDALGSSCVF